MPEVFNETEMHELIGHLLYVEGEVEEPFTDGAAKKLASIGKGLKAMAESFKKSEVSDVRMAGYLIENAGETLRSAAGKLL